MGQSISTNNIVSNSYAGTAAYYQYYWLGAGSCMFGVRCGDIYPAHSSSARDVFRPAWGIISPDNTE
jgi:hypothetical protein